MMTIPAYWNSAVSKDVDPGSLKLTASYLDDEGGNRILWVEF